jgi:hypothetical protein
MTPPSSFRPDVQHQRALAAQFKALDRRIEAAETRQHQLERTIAALAREAGLAVGCPCAKCARSYTLVKSGLVYCPECGYRQSI